MREGEDYILLSHVPELKYFLELTEHENEFIVHHDKLREYGIMTSTRSGDVKSKLEQLMLIEGEDYELRDVS